jgi:hypothetical protein
LVVVVAAKNSIVAVTASEDIFSSLSEELVVIFTAVESIATFFTI